MTLDDLTMLAVVALTGALLAGIFWLGTICATHRIEATLSRF